MQRTKVRRLSHHWQLQINPIQNNLMPMDFTEHYAGDECWCGPYNLRLHHNNPSVDYTTWVHKPQTHIQQVNLQDAFNNLLSYIQLVHDIKD